MASLSKTDLFIHFRNSYHRGGRYPTGSREHNPLLSTAPGSPALPPGATAIHIRPPLSQPDPEWRAWTEQKRQIEKDLEALGDAIERLALKHNMHRYRSVFATEDRARETREAGARIASAVAGLRNRITGLFDGDTSGGDLSQADQVKVNVQLALGNRLCLATNRFQASQSSFLTRTKGYCITS